MVPAPSPFIYEIQLGISSLSLQKLIVMYMRLLSKKWNKANNWLITRFLPFVGSMRSVYSHLYTRVCFVYNPIKFVQRYVSSIQKKH